MLKSLHSENSFYNYTLAKARSKPNKNNWSHKPNRRGFRIMGPNEVLQKLSELGINRTIRTLQRYASKNLIPKPKVTSLGRGQGRISDFPDSTPYELFASFKMINNLKFEEVLVEKARELVLSAEEMPSGSFDSRVKKAYIKDPEYEKIFKDFEVAFCYAIHWQIAKDELFGKTIIDFLYNDNPKIKFKNPEIDRYKPSEEE